MLAASDSDGAGASTLFGVTSHVSDDLPCRALNSLLQFADGSTMRNEFSAATLNGKLDERLFTPELGADYKLVEPLKKP